MLRVSWVILVVSLLGACSAAETPRPDPHSFARPDEAVMTHLDLDVAVDFEARAVTGSATLTLETAADATRLWLDTTDLTIRSVQDQDGASLDWTLHPAEPHLGSPLEIGIGPQTRQVVIDYASSPDAAALLWLSPAQTHDKTSPFLFSQSQAILARSWIPCQDSPGIRFPYQATVRVPPGLLALMSAENPTDTNDDGVYQFTMEQPVPAYLLALAVGDLEFGALSEECGVYAEPGLLETARWEFAQTPEMMEATEAMYGAYPWGRYDILVLPPYFPFGGMENPRLTFATPTILAGDRSLVALIAHELAHSWSGNLVTNRTWGDFWLNEGFTVYLERRIMEEIEGEAYAEMLASLGRGDLEEERERLGAGHPDLALAVDLTGRDPEDTFTDVAYEKGYFFLRRCEELVGREAFDAFLRDYFARHAFGTVDTEMLLEELQAGPFADNPEAWAALDADAWVYRGEFPEGMAEIEPREFDRVDAARSAWLADPTATPDPAGWTTHHWLHFLRGLPVDLTAARLAQLDAAFELSRSGNSEIQNVWYQSAIRAWYEPALPPLADFLEGMGRRKFLRPLYAELAKTERGQEFAREVYTRARPNYHPLATRTIDEVLGWPATPAP